MLQVCVHVKPVVVLDSPDLLVNFAQRLNPSLSGPQKLALLARASCLLVLIWSPPAAMGISIQYDWSFQVVLSKRSLGLRRSLSIHEVCHHRPHSGTFSRSRDDRVIFGFHLPREACVLDQFFTTVPLTTIMPPLVDFLSALSPNRTHPIVFPRPHHHPRHLLHFTSSIYLHAFFNFVQIPRVGFATADLSRLTQSSVAAKRLNLVFFLFDLLWLDCCAVGRLRFLAEPTHPAVPGDVREVWTS